MSRNVIETVMGAVVLAVAVLFLGFAYSSADLGAVAGYPLRAKFDSADGIAIGGDVLLAGVKVGSITGVQLDPKTYLAELTLAIDPAIELPADTVAVVASAGLLGGNVLSLSPGGDPAMLKPGDTIQYTQSTPGLEQLLGQVIFSLQSLSESGVGGGAAPGGAAPAGAAPAPDAPAPAADTLLEQ
jgi:phospholipid/cholesterol/gamma-HCH transport system substrate-binding protein